MTGYLSAHRTARNGQPVTADQARKALRILHRYSLLTHSPNDGPRAVRIHALTARAVWEGVTDFATVAHAADALLELWPADEETSADLVAALRANTATLAEIAGDLLWQPDGPPEVLYRTGRSQTRAGLHSAAAIHWHDMSAQAARMLPERHPAILSARVCLAASYLVAGRISEAIDVAEQTVADRERLLGNDDWQTSTARAQLAESYFAAGWISEAVEIGESVVSGRERLLGDQHLATLSARANLAIFYEEAGRTAEAIRLIEWVVADRGRLLGDDDRKTLNARSNLAVWYWKVGRTEEAVSLQERLFLDWERLFGRMKPQTRAAWSRLVSWYVQVGRHDESNSLLESWWPND